MAVGLSGLLITPSGFAGHSERGWHPDRGWHHHHHYRDHFGRNLLIGGMVGVLAGAAIASANRPYYGYGPDYYGPGYGSCQQVVKRCYTEYDAYGPERVCYKSVERVC